MPTENQPHLIFPQKNATEQGIWEGKCSPGGSVQLWAEEGRWMCWEAHRSPLRVLQQREFHLGMLGVIPQLGTTHSSHLLPLGFHGRFRKANCCLNFPPKGTDLSSTPILCTPRSLHSDFLQGRKIVQTTRGWIHYLAPESSQPHGFTSPKNHEKPPAIHIFQPQLFPVSWLHVEGASRTERGKVEPLKLLEKSMGRNSFWELMSLWDPTLDPVLEPCGSKESGMMGME